MGNWANDEARRRGRQARGSHATSGEPLPELDGIAVGSQVICLHRGSRCVAQVVGIGNGWLLVDGYTAKMAARFERRYRPGDLQLVPAEASDAHVLSLLNETASAQT